MSNLTRLQSVSSSLDTAINKANSLPDAGGGSGGGSIETCDVSLNVLINFEGRPAISHVVYTTVENGSIKENALSVDDMEITIPGYMVSYRGCTLACVVGSPIVLFDGYGIQPAEPNTSDNITVSSVYNTTLYVAVVNSFANDSYINCE